MRQIVIGLAAVAIAAATSTVSASATHHKSSYHGHAKTFGMAKRHGQFDCSAGIPSCVLPPPWAAPSRCCPDGGS
jgi:uncharacterized membrane protein